MFQKKSTRRTPNIEFLTKSTQIFENYEKIKEKIFFIFEFFIMREKNKKMTYILKIMNQNT